MNHFFKHSSDGTRRITRTLQSMIGLVAVGPLLFDQWELAHRPLLRRRSHLPLPRTDRVHHGESGSQHLGDAPSTATGPSARRATRKSSRSYLRPPPRVQRRRQHRLVSRGRACGPQCGPSTLPSNRELMHCNAHLSSCRDGVICSASPSHWTVVIAFG